MKVAIVIPTYNERKNITRLIAAISNYCPHAYILVVDDNSPDKTGDIVSTIAQSNKQVFLIFQDKKTGRGTAVLSGFSYALKNFNADLYIEMDADLSHDPKELSNLITNTTPTTITLASRYIPGATIKDVPFHRRITSALANGMIRTILQMPIHDNTNGFRCYPKKAIKIMLTYPFTTKGYLRLSESAYLLFRHGFHFSEQKTTFINRRWGKSNANAREFFEALVSLFKIRYTYWKYNL